jgi:hypothetical protein
MAEEAVKKKRIYCNYCKQDTNHDLKGEHTTTSHDDEADFGETLTYGLWICMGCEHGVLEQEYGNSEMVASDGADGFDYYSEFSYYPERSEHDFVPKHYTKLKPKLAALYTEAITCYNRKALILCAAGLRALLEGICQDKRIRGRNLKVKIEGLKVLLPNKNIIRNLHHFRFMGNEAVHELAAPKPTELALAISVIEDLLNFLYELDYKASQLREMRRSKKPKVAKPAKAAFATLTITPNS